MPGAGRPPAPSSLSSGSGRRAAPGPLLPFYRCGGGGTPGAGQTPAPSSLSTGSGLPHGVPLSHGSSTARGSTWEGEIQWRTEPSAQELRTCELRGMLDPVAVRPNPVAGKPDPVVVRPDLVAGRPDPAASDCSGGAPWMDSLGNRFLYSLSRLAQCSLNLIRTLNGET